MSEENSYEKQLCVRQGWPRRGRRCSRPWSTDSPAALDDHVKAICPLPPMEDHTGVEGEYFMKETAVHGTREQGKSMRGNE